MKGNAFSIHWFRSVFLMAHCSSLETVQINRFASRQQPIIMYYSFSIPPNPESIITFSGVNLDFATDCIVHFLFSSHIVVTCDLFWTVALEMALHHLILVKFPNIIILINNWFCVNSRWTSSLSYIANFPSTIDTEVSVLLNNFINFFVNRSRPLWGVFFT